MKKRLSKLALLAVAAAFIVAGFPACSEEEEPDPPAQATVAFALADEGSVALTAGETQDVTATLTVTNTAFSEAVKALEAGASLTDYITLSAGDKVSVAATLKEKVEGNTMKITLTVTADADATGIGTITATLNAAALTAAKDVAATGEISYTVKAADPDAPKATFVGDAVELTKGEAKPVTATVTMTQGTFAETIAAEQFALKATDSKVTVTVTAATKTSATVATLTLSVTAEDGAEAGSISVTVKADALAGYDKAIAASGNIAYTVKNDDTSENPPDSEAGTFTLTEASATISLGKKNVGTIASNPNAGGKDYLSAASNNWNTSATVGEFTDEFYNLSGSSRSLTLTVKNVGGFKLYVKNGTPDRTFTVKIGDGDTVTITHPGKQIIDETETDVIPFIFNTGTSDKVAIVLGGGSGSVYPAYVVVYDSAQDIPVEKVEITGIPSSAVLLAEGTVQLGATVSPDRATNKSLIWTSSDNDIATVDNNGLVTLKAAGTVTITAKTTNRKDEAEITIQAEAVAVSGITVTDSDGATSGTMNAGDTQNLIATVSPNDASNKAVVWSSSDDAVATVANGVVTAVASGSATIKATAADGSGVSGEYTLTVKGVLTVSYFADWDKNTELTWTAKVSEGLGTVTDAVYAPGTAESIKITDAPKVGEAKSEKGFGVVVSTAANIDASVASGTKIWTVTFSVTPTQDVTLTKIVADSVCNKTSNYNLSFYNGTTQLATQKGTSNASNINKDVSVVLSSNQTYMFEIAFETISKTINAGPFSLSNVVLTFVPKED